MAHLAKLDSLPFGDYLAQEREVEIRSEYVDGQLYRDRYVAGVCCGLSGSSLGADVPKKNGLAA